MGDQNQIIFGLKHEGLFRPPYLEIGSCDRGYTASFRSFWGKSNQKYIGVDLLEGQGVDYVIDMEQNPKKITKILSTEFASVICLSVLEHTRNPFKIADNIQMLLAAGGVIYVSVPFVWDIHNHPKDFWRFTPDGIRELFPKIQFKQELCCYHSTRKNVFYPLTQGPPRFGRSLSTRTQEGNSFYHRLFDMLKILKIAKKIFYYDYLYPPVQLNMIGIKQGK